jgi:hypothetical protein
VPNYDSSESESPNGSDEASKSKSAAAKLGDDDKNGSSSETDASTLSENTMRWCKAQKK